MALFSYKSFYKPGKGVEKDEPEKLAFFRFFELVFRKIWKLVSINVVYFIVLLPVIMYFYAMVYDAAYYALEAAGLQIGDIYTLLLDTTIYYYSYVPAVVRNILLLVSVVLYGPLKAGVTYVYRNFANERHSWYSDIFEKAKENFGQALIFGVIDFVVLFVLIYNFTYTGEATGMFRVARYVSILFGVIYSFMRKYTYLQVVTIDLPVGAIIKNSWLFAFVGIFRNVISGLSSLAVWVVIYLLIMAVHPFFEIIFLPFFIFSFTGFLSVFSCYPMIEKYLVIPARELNQDIEKKNDDKPSSSLPQ